MQAWTAELLFKTELILGEGAHWHPQWKKFLYVDIEGCKVGRIDPAKKIGEERNLGKRIGAVVPANNGNLVVCLQGSIEELNFQTGERKKLMDIESDKLNNRCNEGKCDVAGRLWIGTMDVKAAMHKGALYCYNGSLKKKIDGVSVSNGICWAKDNSKMYYIDSFDYNIKAYDFDVSNSNISNERIVVKVEEPGFMPDGMTIDEEGMLWVAMWGGGCVNRYNPLDGSLIGKVMVNAPHVTSCAFGGEDMQQMFITTARVGLTDDQLLQHPMSGSLFVIDTGITGSKANIFRYKEGIKDLDLS